MDAISQSPRFHARMRFCLLWLHLDSLTRGQSVNAGQERRFGGASQSSTKRTQTASDGVLRSGPPIAYVGTSSFTGCRPAPVKLLIRQRRQLCVSSSFYLSARPRRVQNHSGYRSGFSAARHPVTGNGCCRPNPRGLRVATASACAGRGGATRRPFFLAPVVQYCGRITSVTRTRQAGPV